MGTLDTKQWEGALHPKRKSHTALKGPPNRAVLTAFGDGLSKPPSLLSTTGFVLAGDSGDLWVGAAEGNLAGWARTFFFPESSSGESVEGLFIPAIPPTGMRHRKQESGGF